MGKLAKFITLFPHLGRFWDLQEECSIELEIFTCRLYGNSLDNINDARCKIYCEKRSKTALTELPPFHSRRHYIYTTKGQIVSEECGDCSSKQTQRSKNQTITDGSKRDRTFALIGWTVNLHQTRWVNKTFLTA